MIGREKKSGQGYYLLGLLLILKLSIVTTGWKSMAASHVTYPFLDDGNTIEYLSQSQTLFLLHGPPGSGKSFLAKKIFDKYPGKAVICSAACHLPEGKKPPFSAEMLEKAHDECEDCVKKNCKEDVHLVIVDNTNLALWEVQKYSKIGHEYNYVVVVVTVQTPWCFDAELLLQKSSRGYTLEAIEEKVEKFKKPLYPLFYGWFVNKADSERMRELGKTWYERCLSNHDFRKEFVKFLLPGPDGETLDPEHYFSSQHYSVGPLLLHCTAFFSNHGEVSQSADYAARDAVKSYLGKAFSLKVIGLLITPRSLGLRLKLGMEELRLWLQDDNTDENAKERDGQQEDKCIITVTSPTCGTGSRAHFSLGSGPGVEPVQTGLDLVEIIKMEQEAVRLKRGFTCSALDGGMAQGFGQGIWMIYFDHPVTVKALFSGFF